MWFYVVLLQQLDRQVNKTTKGFISIGRKSHFIENQPKTYSNHNDRSFNRSRRCQFIQTSRSVHTRSEWEKKLYSIHHPWELCRLVQARSEFVKCENLLLERWFQRWNICIDCKLFWLLECTIQKNGIAEERVVNSPISLAKIPISFKNANSIIKNPNFVDNRMVTLLSPIRWMSHTIIWSGCCYCWTIRMGRTF